MEPLFPSFKDNEDDINMNKLYQGSLFHTVEYELSTILNKIDHIDELDDDSIKQTILNQHHMILNYDLFLTDVGTRDKALKLFTNKKFLNCFYNVIRMLDLSRHEIICLNKIAYDYYILEDKDKEVGDLLYRLTTEVNGKQVVVLSGILGIYGAQVLSMIRNSTFKEEKAVHRVNTFLLKCNCDLSIQQLISIYCYLFDRFMYPFIYTMLETKPAGLSKEQNVIFDRISLALLAILDSLSSADIYKVIQDYGFTLSLIKSKNISVRFSLKSARSYTRILSIIKDVELNNIDIIIP